MDVFPVKIAEWHMIRLASQAGACHLQWGELAKELPNVLKELYELSQAQTRARGGLYESRVLLATEDRFGAGFLAMHCIGYIVRYLFDERDECEAILLALERPSTSSSADIDLDSLLRSVRPTPERTSKRISNPAMFVRTLCTILRVLGRSLIPDEVGKQVFAAAMVGRAPSRELDRPSAALLRGVTLLLAPMLESARYRRSVARTISSIAFGPLGGAFEHTKPIEIAFHAVQRERAASWLSASMLRRYSSISSPPSSPLSSLAKPFSPHSSPSHTSTFTFSPHFSPARTSTSAITTPPPLHPPPKAGPLTGATTEREKREETKSDLEEAGTHVVREDLAVGGGRGKRRGEGGGEKEKEKEKDEGGEEMGEGVADVRDKESEAIMAAVKSAIEEGDALLQAYDAKEHSGRTEARKDEERERKIEGGIKGKGLDKKYSERSDDGEGEVEETTPTPDDQESPGTKAVRFLNDPEVFTIPSRKLRAPPPASLDSVRKKEDREGAVDGVGDIEATTVDVETVSPTSKASLLFAPPPSTRPSRRQSVATSTPASRPSLQHTPRAPTGPSSSPISPASRTSKRRASARPTRGPRSSSAARRWRLVQNMFGGGT